MAIWDNWLDKLAVNLAGRINDTMAVQYGTLGKYYAGDHRPQLKTKVGKQDDNVTLNYIGLAVDRSVSRLFRGGIEFNLPDGAEAQQEYIDTVDDARIEKLISRLRSKIEPDPSNPQYLVTVRGRGYKLTQQTGTTTATS